MKWPWCRNRNNTDENKEPQYTKKECDHRWKDFDWTIIYNDIPINRKVNYEIRKPYVCIHCKKRKEVVLEVGEFRAITVDDVKKGIKKIRDKYPKISPIAVVQDQIYDMQLVDRDYLRIASQVMGVKL